MVKQEIRTRLKTYEYRTLDQSADEIVETAKRTGASVFGPILLPTECNLYITIRATHKHKDLREQFGMRIRRRLINIMNLTPKAVSALMKLDLPSGVNIEIKL